jgi:hypothetical protein
MLPLSYSQYFPVVSETIIWGEHTMIHDLIDVGSSNVNRIYPKGVYTPRPKRGYEATGYRQSLLWA